MSPIKELLELVLAEFQTDLRIAGMCAVINELYLHNDISDNEHRLLIAFLEQNALSGCTIGEHWWLPGLKAPRIEWLTRKVSKL